jgi:hypothetical protein
MLKLAASMYRGKKIGRNIKKYKDNRTIKDRIHNTA